MTDEFLNNFKKLNYSAKYKEVKKIQEAGDIDKALILVENLWLAPKYESPDNQKLNEFDVVLELIKHNLLIRFKLKKEKNAVADNNDFKILFQYLEAIEKYNKIKFGQKSVHEEKQTMEIIQRKVLELNKPDKKVTIFDKARSYRKKLRDKNEVGEEDAGEISSTPGSYSE